ncbi:hypothetical protein EDD17DRAFT_1588792 [Pisolithus thermaeus]|nr:hypothetical protein EV401DRAFT_1336238 [Pisolithus croceorrhizus]KAI6161280.1 hypothetical protein EDD17DRAFT_1588792 [Pisolithus thermaeus]
MAILLSREDKGLPSYPLRYPAHCLHARTGCTTWDGLGQCSELPSFYREGSVSHECKCFTTTNQLIPVYLEGITPFWLSSFTGWKYEQGLPLVGGASRPSCTVPSLGFLAFGNSCTNEYTRQISNHSLARPLSEKPTDLLSCPCSEKFGDVWFWVGISYLHTCRLTKGRLDRTFAMCRREYLIIFLGYSIITHPDYVLHKR